MTRPKLHCTPHQRLRPWVGEVFNRSQVESSFNVSPGTFRPVLHLDDSELFADDLSLGRLAEIVGQYSKKGSSVYVEGRLPTRKYTDKDGVEKYATDIIAEQMRMLGSRQGGEGGAAHEGPLHQASGPAPVATGRPAPKPAEGFSDMDDDITVLA
jgi:single stranded DNA-binding protein